MRLLLDTVAMIWWIRDDPHLGRDARAAIADPANDVFLSAASVWEVEIKRAKRRAELDVEVIEEMAGHGIAGLAVTVAHAVRAGRLPQHHADPFDRMLVAQAQLEGLALVTSDSAIGRYDVLVVPAR